MIGEALRNNPDTCVVSPAQITGWQQQLRIDTDKSRYLHVSTAETWQKLATQCMNYSEPLMNFEEELRQLYPNIIFEKAKKHWCIMPLGDWAGMPRIYLDLQETPLYGELSNKGKL